MKCLCGSKNCRGVIGGTQDKEGSAATRAAIEAAVEPTPGEEDPDFIMVEGAPLVDMVDFLPHFVCFGLPPLIFLVCARQPGWRFWLGSGGCG